MLFEMGRTEWRLTMVYLGFGNLTRKEAVASK